MTRKKLIRNRIRCLNCGDIIESKAHHDFKSCSCGNCQVYGGLMHARRSWPSEEGKTAWDFYEELSEWKEEE